MKLIKAYINNFGQLSDFTYDFQNGLNIIEEENGWGKTTFAAFLKAMLFGMEYKRGTVNLVDRTRYMPWNGKTFGGTLEFEVNQKVYLVERSFKKKEAEDTFILYDLMTNMESHDFTTNLGEEIWKVDRDSYEKTAFIKLKDTGLLSDIISGRLGNIEEQEADMEASTKAITVLEKEMKVIKTSRKDSGELGQKKMENQKVEEELRRCKSSQDFVENNEIWIANEEENLSGILKEEEQLEEEQGQITLLLKKKQLEELEAQVNDVLSQYNQEKAFFKKEITEEELVLLSRDIQKISVLESKIKDSNLNQQEKIEYEEGKKKFLVNPLKESEVLICEEHLERIKEMQIEKKGLDISEEELAKYERLHEKYHGTISQNNQIDRYIDDYNQCMTLKEKESNLSAELKRLEGERSSSQREQQHKSTFGILGILGVIVLLVGIGIGILVSILGMVVAAVGALLIVVQLMNHKKAKNRSQNREREYREMFSGLEVEQSEVKSERANREEAYMAFLNKIQVERSHNIIQELINAKMECKELQEMQGRIKMLKEKEEALTAQIKEREKEVIHLLDKYVKVNCDSDLTVVLSTLRKIYKGYTVLQQKEIEMKKSLVDLGHLQKKIEEKLEVYCHVELENYNTSLDIIKEKKVRLNGKKENLETVMKKYQDFQENNDIDILKNLAYVEKSEEEMRVEFVHRRNELSKRKQEINKKIVGYKKDIENAQNEIDKMVDLESERDRNRNCIAEMETKHKLLSFAKACMDKAKENLAIKYMKVMSNSFKKYLALLGIESTDTFSVDVNLNVTQEQQGERRESSRLSTGKQDLIQVCMRMALVEAVYKDVDQPILILDDPFVNLDKSSVEKGIQLLRNIGEEYQVIYFVCHESRA